VLDNQIYTFILKT